MALLGQWTGGTVAGVPAQTFAAPANLFPTEARNDSSTYSFAASTSTLTLPSTGLADGYLLVGAYEYEDTSNFRATLSGRFIQSVGTGNLANAVTGGFCRKTSDDRIYVRTWAFVDSPSASAAFQFQWRRDADAPTGGTVRSELQVIPLYYSNAGIYSSANIDLNGGITPNKVAGWSSTYESDTAAIELATDTVTTKNAGKKYLTLGSQYYETTSNDRSQNWSGLTVDGVDLDSAKSYSYFRNTNNNESGGQYTWIVDGAKTIESYTFRGYGVLAGEGGATNDVASKVVGDHTLVVLELNDNAEVFESTGSTVQNFATGVTVDVQATKVADIDFNDAASFTRATDTGMNAEQDFDGLFGSNIGAASEALTGDRFTASSNFTVNGIEESLSFHGNFLRGVVSGGNTLGWSSNNLGFQALTTGDDIGLSLTELAGSDGGGGDVSTQVGWVGFWGVNLDTLEADAGASITANVTEQGDTTAAIANVVVGVSANVIETGDTTSAAINTPVSISASITENGDTTAAAIQTQQSANIVASLIESGDITSAAINTPASISANTIEAGDTVLAVIESPSSISASTAEQGDTTAANASVVIGLISSLTEAGDTTAANISNVVQLFASTTEAGDTSSAAFDSVAGIAASTIEQGDSTAAVINSTVAFLAASNDEEGDTTAAFISPDREITAIQIEAGDLTIALISVASALPDIGEPTITSLTPKYTAIDASSIYTAIDASDEYMVTSATSDYNLKSETDAYTITKEAS